MRRSGKRFAAFSAALAVLVSGLIPAQFAEVQKISAAGVKPEYYVKLKEDPAYSRYATTYIYMDGEYRLYNIADVISCSGNPDTFIVPSKCQPPETNSLHEDDDDIIALGSDSIHSGNASGVIIPEGIIEIYDNAFYDAMAIKTVTFGSSLKRLDEQRFLPETILRGRIGSLAEKYADENGYKFEYIGDVTNSGKIDAADLLKLASYIYSDADLDEDESSRADENLDGKLDIVDFIMLKNEILEPGNSVIGASFDGALAKPDVSYMHEDRISKDKDSAKGYMNFAVESASAVLLDTEDQNGADNTVYSPLSYFMALSMAAECADGTTQDEFIKALGAEDITDLRRVNTDLFRSLYFDDYYSYCKIANSLWLNNKWEFRKDTLDTIAENYYAPVFSKDFKDSSVPGEIASWISKNTSGKFLPVIKIKDPELEVMKILNTVTFKEAWAEDFREAEPDTFTLRDGTEVTGDFLSNQWDHKDVGFADKYMKCSLPMKDDFKMNFVLPDEGVDIDEIIADKAEMKKIFDDDLEYYTGKTVFKVPKFDVESKFSLEETTKALGIKEAFDDVKADFNGIIDYDKNDVPSARINEVTQEVKVTIDEKGCEAASYTIIALSIGAGPPSHDEPVYFVLDRPFFYYISDADGIPLFSGIINDPNNK